MQMQPRTSSTNLAGNVPSSPLNRKPEPKIQIKSEKRRGGSFLLNVSIGTRLTLGFLIAAVIAAIVAGTLGVQRSQSLDRQSRFYQDLLVANTNLNTGAQYLQLMKTQSQKVLDQVNNTQTSQENLKNDITALKGLQERYNKLLNDYIDKGLVTHDQGKIDILTRANHQAQVGQQNTLADSSSRTWSVHQTSLNTLLNYIERGQVADANTLAKLQVEPTNSDALSSLRALIQFNIRLASSVEDSAKVEEQNQLITTIISSIIAFIAIIFIGWLISSTIVHRLRLLRQVTQAVEQGQLNRRVTVMGRDEIADVSASVNAMLEAITGLLDETRSQRDALTNAAEHLFSDMRVVSAGDLRINAPVSNDPIGMLANAFNFTVGRFRRFVQRTKTTAEQMDVIARQELERTEAFIQNVQNASKHINGMPTTQSKSFSQIIESNSSQTQLTTGDDSIALVQQTRDQLQRLSSDGHARSIASLTEQLAGTIERLNKWQMSMGGTGIRQEESRGRYTQEIRLLESLVGRLLSETQSIQKETSRNVQQLDKELAQLTINMRKSVKTGESNDVSSLTSARLHRESIQEINRLCATYTSDVQSLAQQLGTLAQEIRTGIINFQLDTIDSGGNMPSMPMTPASPFSPMPGANSAINAPLYPGQQSTKTKDSSARYQTSLAGQYDNNWP